MQVLIGRLTENAKVAALKDERQVVNFSLAMNHTYTPKGGERTKKTTFVQCAYWKSTGIADYLKKGTLVEVYGFIAADAYTNLQGEPKGVLRFHCNSIQVHGSSRQQTENTQSATTSKGKRKSPVKTVSEITEPADDLPF